MNKAVWRIFGLLIIVAIIVVASYRFSTRQHTEVVEHRPPMPDIPGAAFFDVTAMQSEAGKRFAKKAIFTVMMHSAAGHLFDYDLKLFVILKGNGVEYKPSDWRESNRSSEFHRRGILT